MKFTSYTIFLLLILYSCSNFNQSTNHIELPKVKVGITVPQEYIPMNANEYYQRFYKKSGVDKEFAREVIKRMKELAGSVSAYTLVQDSTSSKNSILVYSSPYIKLNNDNFELLRILSHKQIKKQFKGKGEVVADTFYLDKGHFPYGRTCYSVTFEGKNVQVNDYVVSMPHQLISVMVCNEKGDDMEEMIKYIEEWN